MGFVNLVVVFLEVFDKEFFFYVVYGVIFFSVDYIVIKV